MPHLSSHPEVRMRKERDVYRFIRTVAGRRPTSIAKGASVSTRSTYSRVRSLPVFLAFVFNMVLGPLTPFVSLPAAALGTSSFNALDGNLTDDGTETDWCTPAPNLVPGYDSPSGSSDTSFSSNNNKEDSDIPTLANGTIPNNKDDLLREYVASETIGSDLYVYLAWIRADATGTSTI